MRLRNLHFPALLMTTLFSFQGVAATLPIEQSSGAARPEFEVASIKPNSSGSGLTAYGCHGTDSTRANGMTVINQVVMTRGMGPAPSNQPTVIPAPLGRCAATNAPLNVLIAYAYGLNVGPGQVNQKVLGGPAWAATARFDIEAKAESPLPESELRAMLQTLLADQFKLQVHHDAKEGQGYILTVAKGGPKLKVSADDSSGGQGPGGGVPAGGMRAMSNGGQMAINAPKTTMANFVNFLSARLGKTVVDETKLNEKYDISLTYTPAEGEAGFFGAAGGGAASDPAPSLFTALQEQLGLRLESGKVTTETIVIDRAEKPPQQ